MKGPTRVIICLISLGLAGCQGAPPAQTPIAADDARLEYAFDRPAGGSERHVRVSAPDRPYSEERYNWQSATDPLNDAGLVLRELNPGAAGFGFAVPEDPKASVTRWSVLADKTLFFEDPFGTSNDYGPALWRRFTRGGSVCVVFLQTWPPAGQGAVTRTLEGYYCAGSGARLSAGQAEQVVQSVRVTFSAPAAAGPS